MEKKLQTNLIVTNETFTDEAGNQMPYVAFTMYLSGEPFVLKPLKKDKKLIDYLIKRNKFLDTNEYKTVVNLSQEQFRDKNTRKYINYVSYVMTIANREFKLFVKDTDKLLVKYLLEEDYDFVIDDLNIKEDDEDDNE
jgi:hypothetical protein